jgi:hypothetical protein
MKIPARMLDKPRHINMKPYTTVIQAWRSGFDRINHSTICTAEAWVWWQPMGSWSHGWANTWTWARGNGRIGAEHANTRSELGTTERDHVLANMAGNHFTVLRV